MEVHSKGLITENIPCDLYSGTMEFSLGCAAGDDESGVAIDKARCDRFGILVGVTDSTEQDLLLAFFVGRYRTRDGRHWCRQTCDIFNNREDEKPAMETASRIAVALVAEANNLMLLGFFK